MSVNKKTTIFQVKLKLEGESFRMKILNKIILKKI